MLWLYDGASTSRDEILRSWVQNAGRYYMPCHWCIKCIGVAWEFISIHMKYKLQNWDFIAVRNYKISHNRLLSPKTIAKRPFRLSLNREYCNLLTFSKNRNSFVFAALSFCQNIHNCVSQPRVRMYRISRNADERI